MESGQERRDEERQAPPAKRFSVFFKHYAIAISLVVSSLPIAASLSDVVPQFEALKPLLTFTSSLSSFLLVGFIFSYRHGLARKFFPGFQAGNRRVAYAREMEGTLTVAWLPMALWLTAVGAVIGYSALVNHAVEEIAFQHAHQVIGEEPMQVECGKLEKAGAVKVAPALLSGFPGNVEVRCWQGQSGLEYEVRFLQEGIVETIRKRTPAGSVPGEMWMGLAFVLTFACATSAFVLTGLKDYLQAELGLSDRDLILSRTLAAKRARFDVKGMPGLYGIVEYSPVAPELEPETEGPYCVWHKMRPDPKSVDAATGRVTAWQHVDTSGKTPVEIPCDLAVEATMGEMDERFEASTQQMLQEMGRGRKG